MGVFRVRPSTAFESHGPFGRCPLFGQQSSLLHCGEGFAHFGGLDRPDAREAFVQRLEQGGLLHQAAASAEVRRFVQSLTCSSWFTTSPESGILWETETGTVPGSPIADTLFAIIYASYLSDLQASLRERGFSSSVANCQDSDTPTWADDTAVLFQAASASAAAHVLEEVAALAYAGMTRLGLQPNLGAGKTEAILSLRGTGSREVRRSIYCAATPGVCFQGPDGRSLFLRIVQEYVHLGSLVRADGHDLPDIKARAALMRRSLAPLRSRILTNPFVTRSEKCQLFAQRVTAKFTHGAGLWRVATAHEWQAAHEPLRSAQRSVLRSITGHSCRGLDSHEIAALLSLPTAEETLRVERIRAGREAARLDARTAWPAHLADAHWLGQIGQDLAVIYSADQCYGHFMLPASPAQVLAHLRGFDVALKGACKRFLQRSVAARAELGAAAARKATQGPPPEHTILIEDELEAGAESHACSQCGKVFSDARTCAVHLARAHGIAAEVTRITHGTRCQVCGIEFWEEHRLRTHVRRTSLCYNAYWHCDIECDPGGHREDRQLHARQPAVVTPGPQPFWAQLRPGAP